MTDAKDIVRTLGMRPHPEGGWYIEIHRSPLRVHPLPACAPRSHPTAVGAQRTTHADAPSRAAMTSICYMLERGQRSHWHRVDADELWSWHAGAPMELSIAPLQEAASAGTPAAPVRRRDAPQIAVHRLGMDLAHGERPQAVVPAYAWQSAQPLGDWSLVGCVVAPGFEFGTFELAPEGWSPH